MTIEETLTRLAQAKKLPRPAKMRRRVLARIQGSVVTRLVESVPAPQKSLRAQVLNRLTHPTTQAALETVRTLASPTVDAVLSLKSEVLNRIGAIEPSPTWQRYGKWVAVTAVLTLLIRITPTFFIAPTLQASSQNLLLPTEGFVSITDGAEWSGVGEETIIDHPITIRTGSDSSATVILGLTLVRLGENSEVTLQKPAFDSNVSGPIARISYGRTWVSSMVPQPLFVGTTITFPQGLVAVKDGSVDVFADPLQSTVRVFHRFARVLPTGEDPVHLIEGDQLTVLPEGQTQRHLMTDVMRQEDWVVQNLSRDAVHRTEVTENKQERAENVAGILPTSAFYSLKRASEAADLLMTLSGKARTEKKLQHAQTRLNEAVALLKAGESEAAKSPLADYRETLIEFASVSELEAKDLLSASLVESSTAVASALPHSDLYPAKETLIEIAAATEAAEILPSDVDLYLLSDALLGIESLITQGEIVRALMAFNGIEGAVASLIDGGQLDETELAKNELKAIKTILRSIAYSLEQAEDLVHADSKAMLAALQEQVDLYLPASKSTVIAVREEPAICMTVREVTRRTNQFLASVYTYETPRAQRNEVLRQIASLPDCPQSSRILSKVMNKVPVFTRSFVWEALQTSELNI